MSGVSPYKVGDVFGNKKIVEYCGSDPKLRVSLWKYECTLCGSVNGPVRTATITRKDRQNSLPECCHPRYLKGSSNPAWQGYQELSGTWLHSYEYNAKKRGIEWDITPAELWEQWLKQEGKCAYTGMPLVHGNSASIDRKDSSKPYRADNVQWVHTNINRMKSDFSEELFLHMCKQVSDFVGFDSNAPRVLSDFSAGRI